MLVLYNYIIPQSELLDLFLFYIALVPNVNTLLCLFPSEYKMKKLNRKSSNINDRILFRK